MAINEKIIRITKEAKDASMALSVTGHDVKNKALKAMAQGLKKNAKDIASANKKDLMQAKRTGFSRALIDRLTLNQKRIGAMIKSIEDVINLKDPIGEITRMWKRPNGLIIGKMRVPIGVICIIYESRPNVTCDCAALCIKSGNAVILKGGKEAINTNAALVKMLKQAMVKSGLPASAIGFIDTTDRKAVDIILNQNSHIDLVIPRGGEGLIRAVAKKSTIPVIKHYKGVCHTYVDKDADLKKAAQICFNAKVQRPGVCNAMETLLVDESIASRFLPPMIEMFKKANVEIRGCKRTMQIIKAIKAAKKSDWHEEYLDLILAVKIVNGLDKAIEHITEYGSRHSDAIITQNHKTALEFLKRVDSACVYANASTRFTDGYEFGLGAEIGISTDKIHARGPMALEELTSYKYIILGSGQIRR